MSSYLLLAREAWETWVYVPACTSTLYWSGLLLDNALSAWLWERVVPILQWLRMGWNITPLLVLAILFVVLFTLHTGWRIFGPFFLWLLHLFSFLLPSLRRVLRQGPAVVFWLSAMYILASMPFFQSLLLFLGLPLPLGGTPGDQPGDQGGGMVTPGNVVLQGPGGAGTWMQILDPTGRLRWVFAPGNG